VCVHVRGPLDPVTPVTPSDFSVWCPRLCGAGPAGPGAPAGVLLAGGADDRADVAVRGPARHAHLLPGPLPEQVHTGLSLSG